MRLWNIPSFIGMALIVCGLLALAVHSEWPILFHNFVGTMAALRRLVLAAAHGFAAIMVGVVLLLMGSTGSSRQQK